jgi:hypothetical protein
MASLWSDALPALALLEDELDTPWGTVDMRGLQETVSRRLDWLSRQDLGTDLGPLWNMERPALELS